MRFCNVLFKDLKNAVYDISGCREVFIDNCEFENNYDAVRLLDSGFWDMNKIRDTIFRDTYSYNLYGKLSADNIEIENMGQFTVNSVYYGSVTNSDITDIYRGSYADQCLKTFSVIIP